MLTTAIFSARPATPALASSARLAAVAVASYSDLAHPRQTSRSAASCGRRAALLSLLLLSAPTRPAGANSPASFAQMAQAAFAAFERADYLESERLWRAATEQHPKEGLGWANLAVALIINASDKMTLGVLPTGEPLQRLEEALSATERAEALGAADGILLNSRGNALGLLQRWGEARAAYAAATTLSPRDFESIPRSNEALALMQLEEPAQAEALVRRIMRRDPNFVDAFALLAAVRWMQGDPGGTARAIAQLCGGGDGRMWCARYSTEQVVLGRWTPRAVEAYRELLKEKSVQLELKNGLI